MDILEFKDIKTVPDIVHQYTSNLRNNSIPIVIDNGSYNCRAGWAVSEKPLLIFKNVLAKPRRERGKKDGEMQVGNDITNIEAVRFQLKSQFDRNVVTHFEVQEYIFNYTFSHLGIDTEYRVDHPIVISEPFLNPNYSRALMSELLFECYNVPGVCYAVDCLASYNRDKNASMTTLLISLGQHATHLVPILDGQVQWKFSRRLDIGGHHLSAYMHRLLQLKYPAHFNAITLSRAEELVHDHCRVSESFLEELALWSDVEYYDANVIRVQLPYTVGPSSTLTPDQQRERRRELKRRFMEINARKREEKLAEDEEQLNQLLAIQDLREEGEEAEFEKALSEFGLSNSEELPKLIGQIQARIERTRQKIVTANTTEDISEENKQKTMKQFNTPKDEEDFKIWLDGVRRKREELLEWRAARRQRRQDMARRRTVASVERMRLISQLAGGGKADDDFGTRDEDWDVYKVINKEGGDSDSEEEGEKLLQLEQMLRAHDPSFSTASQGDGTNSGTGSGGEGGEAPGETHRLHVGVELIRVPEVLFQPSLVGSDQAGLIDTVEYILKQFSHKDAERLAADICLCGGSANLKGLARRMSREIIQIRPFKSKVSVRISKSPSFGGWFGLRDIALNENLLSGYSITSSDYKEKGAEHLKQHRSSNPYFRTPLPNLDVEIEVA
ncbi:actin-related protein 5 isoform X2 [Rhodnius prolixus]|uniref:actin-related protein 5 isoform X2 n=1 Tax=Rhodnius prolixus TaxID=13249 RepID=UPI003D18ECBE